VDIIATSGAVAVRAAQRATSQIPIIFAAVPSPRALVDIGLAASVERPGANITGFSSFDPEQASKSFGLLKEILPSLESVAVLSDQDIPHSPSDPGWSPFERAYDTAARAAGLRPYVMRVKGPNPDLDGAFAAMMREKVQAVLVLEVPVPLQHLARIAEIAGAHRLPTMFPGGYPNSGGLINFGTTIFDANRAMSEYIDRVLKGAKPGDLPIGVKNRNELVINLMTAREIGVTIPPDVTKRADRVL
jgi:putative tryptophan/tyrosine transport system substrate-binding protein